MIMKISTIMSANFEGLHISNIVLNPRLHYPVSLLLSSAPSNRIIQANALSTSFNFLMVLDSVFKKIWIKKYRILYPKKLVLEKVSDSVSEKFGIRNFKSLAQRTKSSRPLETKRRRAQRWPKGLLAINWGPGPEGTKDF